MDRYRDIQAAEDLGLVDDDNTEDLLPERLLLPRQVQERAHELGVHITRAKAIAITHQKTSGDSTPYEALIRSNAKEGPALAGTSDEADVQNHHHEGTEL